MTSARINLELTVLAIALSLAGACKASVDADGDDEGSQQAGSGADAGTTGEVTAGAAGDSAGAAGDSASMLGDGGVPTAGTGGGSAPTGSNPFAIDLTWSDATIASVLHTALTTAVQRAELGASSGSDQGVRDLSASAITSLMTTQSRLDLVLSMEGLTAEPSSVSEEISVRTATMMTQMEALSGSEFDIAYLNAQIDLQADVMALISAEILPNVVNAQLMTGAQAVRATLRDNVDAAAALLETLAPAP